MYWKDFCNLIIIVVISTAFLPLLHGQKSCLGITTGYSFQRYQFENGHGYNLSVQYTKDLSKRWGYRFNLLLSNTYSESIISGKQDNVEYNSNLNYIDYPNGIQWFPIDNNTFNTYQNYNFYHLHPKVNYGHDYILNVSLYYVAVNKEKFKLHLGFGTGIGLANSQEVLSSYTWTPFLGTLGPNDLIKYEFQRQVRYLYWEGNFSITGKYKLSERLNLLLEASYNYKPEMVIGKNRLNLSKAGVSRLNLGIEVLIND